MSGQIVYQAKNFAVRSATFDRADTGERKDITYIDQPAVAVAIPVLDDNRIILARQWRPLVGEVLLECPGGKVEGTESPEDAVRRELSEEIGYTPREIRRLGHYFSSVGASTEHIYFFVASRLTKVRRRKKDQEEIELVYLTLAEAREQLYRSAFLDGKTMLALFTYFSKIQY